MKSQKSILNLTLSILVFGSIISTNIVTVFGQTNSGDNTKRSRIDSRNIKIIRSPNAKEADWLSVSKTNDQLLLGNRDGLLKFIEIPKADGNLFPLQPVSMNQDKTPLRQILFMSPEEGYVLKRNSIYTHKGFAGFTGYFTQPITKPPGQLTPDFWNIDFSGNNNACIVGVTLKKNTKKEDVVDSGLLICNQDFAAKGNKPENWRQPTLPETFRINPKIPSQLTDIHFMNDGEGWLVGASGIIWHTNNDGREWKEQISNTANPLLSVYAINKENVWAIGFNSTILHLSKEKSSSDSQQKNGNVTKTEDKKETSTNTEKSTDKSTIEKIAEIPGKVAEKVTEKTQEILGTGNSQTTVTITREDSNTSTTTTQNAITESKPATWKTLERNPLENLNTRLWSVKFAEDEKNGWIIGDAGTILYTANGGETWEKIKLLTDQNKPSFPILPNFYAMHIDDKYCWIVGSEGVIVRIKYKGNDADCVYSGDCK